MITSHRFHPVLLLVLLVTTACGGGEATGDTAATAPESPTVTMTDSAFDPAAVEVATGGTVRWANDDDVPHTVTFTDDSVSSSEQLDTGDDFSATFDTAGAFDYVCAIHPDMTGTVAVR